MLCTFITLAVYASIAGLFLSMKGQESWRGKHRTQEGFSKEDKEALNFVCFIFYAQIRGIYVNWMAFAALLIKRLYRKAFTWDMKPANKAFFRQNVVNFDEEVDKYVKEKLATETNPEFADFIYELAEKNSQEVLDTYEAARLVATLIEYEEVRTEMRPDSVAETRADIVEALNRFNDFPHFREIVDGYGVYKELKNLLTSISWARYTFRWQGYTFRVRCSILTHMLEAAVLGWLMALEKGDEKLAEEALCVMMFHDVAEIWTDDIPSPAKDGLKLRKISEKLELQVLEEKFYTAFAQDEKLVKFFKSGIMLEDIGDPTKKKFMKAADYFSADLEVWWSIANGCRDRRFINILRRSIEEGNRTPAAKALLEKYIDEVKDEKFF